MEAAHLGSGNRICTVVFADIVRYTEESVSRQVEMKAAFGEILTTALEHTPAADRSSSIPATARRSALWATPRMRSSPPTACAAE